jgi:predicted transcriptional regulator
MPKAKVSITVDEVLLRRCDEAARGRSRSQVIEQALAHWLRAARRQRLEIEIERYYGEGMEPAERARDAAWAGLSARSLGETWK